MSGLANLKNRLLSGAARAPLTHPWSPGVTVEEAVGRTVIKAKREEAARAAIAKAEGAT